MIRVYLLDDHEVVRRGLRELLEVEEDLEVVGESASAQEAARRVPALRPNVMVLDARLPDGSGIDVCRDVRSIDPTVAGIILTSYDDDEALQAAVLAGAAGYLLKDIKGSRLVDSIRRVAAGESLLDDSVVSRLRAQWGHDVQDPRLELLSPQERRILSHIAEGLTNRQIGEVMSLAEKTVKNYVTSVLAKMGMERRTQAAIYMASQAAPSPRPGERRTSP
jgi:DNA-binding NarL/FixJ family response regulator